MNSFDPPQAVLHAYDKVYTDIFDSESEGSGLVAEKIVLTIKEFEKGNPDRPFKLGLTTGSTPSTLYEILSRKCAEGVLSFRNVEIFSIDEYYHIDRNAAQSRNRLLHDALLNNIDIASSNVHILDSSAPDSYVPDYCAEFDIMARNLDLLVIGVGEEGQIGFNEACTPEYTRTRMVMLSYQSRKRQSRYFNGDLSATPKYALTMGLGTMMSAKKVYLMAWGEEKATAVHRIVEEDYDNSCPAAIFQHHMNVRLFVDKAAGSMLTREVAPWLVGSCEWTPKLRRKAVVWLCGKLGKPLLKLTQEDYMKNSLESLLSGAESVGRLNMDLFHELENSFTGWPAGKDGPRKVLIFSPHPDDDVISMGGTFIRLVRQGHNVHVAYETSGNIAVHDDVVLQHMDAAFQLGFEDRSDKVRSLIASRKSGEAEPRELLEMKGAIRRSEARGADRSIGLDDSHIHFLNLPFYESGGVKKLPRSQADIDIIKNLLQSLEPEHIYLAGDLADPHGTHRVCTEAVLEALEQLRYEGAGWVTSCRIWLYRGAWMEWDISLVDMAVPLSPEEVITKRHAIFHHLSQKDIVPFPGEDSREFWQRAEDRTSRTAFLYNELGLPEYQAVEVFVRYEL